MSAITVIYKRAEDTNGYVATIEEYPDYQSDVGTLDQLGGLVLRYVQEEHGPQEHGIRFVYPER